MSGTIEAMLLSAEWALPKQLTVQYFDFDAPMCPARAERPVPRRHIAPPNPHAINILSSATLNFCMSSAEPTVIRLIVG